MKFLTNAKQARCSDCNTVGELIPYEGNVHCSICGSLNIVNKDNGERFIPEFTHRTYRRNKYTPPIPDRRSVTKPFPKIRDRRKR